VSSSKPRASVLRRAYPLALSWLFRYFPPAVAKLYIVSFRTHDERRPYKFIVLADSMKSAINVAWEHGGADFHLRFDRSTGQAQEMKEGALRVLRLVKAREADARGVVVGLQAN
jgi:hypothetical protein